MKLTEITEIHYVNGPLRTEGPEQVAIPADIELPCLIPIYRALDVTGENEANMESHSYYVSLLGGKVIGQHVLPIPHEILAPLIEKMQKERSKAA